MVRPQAVSQEIASLVRGGNPISAIRRLREETGLGLRDAKAIQLHITRVPGQCQQCSALLPANPVVLCEQCRSLNYNW
jgi:hypothetical protein